jgi:hypothetical protein
MVEKIRPLSFTPEKRPRLQYFPATALLSLCFPVVRRRFRRAAPKADPEAQREFLVTDYKKAKENSGEGGPLYFADGVHPQHNPIAGYGWIKRGKDFPLPTNTGRRRLNINGAIDITTMAAEVRMDDTINGESTLALIQQIEAKCVFRRR